MIIMIAKKLLKHFIIIPAICISFCTSGQDKFIKLKDTILMSSLGNPITLHAVNLGGWLLWEGWMWGGGFTKESVIKERLYNLLGKEAYTKFLQQYYDNYITEKDIALIAQHGFNCIRLPFNYRIFEADNNQYIDGFKKLDEVISWCKKYGLYVIPDMHAAPGGQNNLFISDPENTKLWNSEENQKHANDLWRKIAERYNNDTTIAGYDILNEPDVNNTATLIDFYKTLVKNIRSVDTNHLLIIEGNNLAHSFKGFPAKLDDNQVYSYHYYPWFNEKNKLKNLKNITSEINTSLLLWCGEWGEDTPENLKEISKLLSAQPNQCGTAFWTWKRIYKNNNRYPLYSIHSIPDWDKIVAWLTWKISKPNKEQTAKGIEEFLNGIKIENCEANEISNIN